jgi:hypothetical protein
VHQINLPLFIILLCLVMPATGLGAEQKPNNLAIDTLAKLEYKREVLVYCGISDGQAVQGFLDRQAQLVERYSMTESMQLQAASDARQAAYAEWQNRGLGGFRGWCRKEGSDYTAILKSYVIDSGIQGTGPGSVDD